MKAISKRHPGKLRIRRFLDEEINTPVRPWPAMRIYTKLVIELRLYFAELLLDWAFSIMPDGSEEKLALAKSLKKYVARFPTHLAA